MSAVAETPSAVAVSTDGKGASRRGYWIALAVLVTGVTLAVTWGVRSVEDARERASGFPRVDAPGAVAVPVTGTGSQTIYFSGPRDADLGQLGLQVRTPSGAAIPLTTFGRPLAVDLAGHAGRGVATFRADEVGTYTVTAAAGGRGAVIAVGHNVARDVMPGIFGALALMLGSAIAAVVIALGTLVRRSSGLS